MSVEEEVTLINFYFFKDEFGNGGNVSSFTYQREALHYSSKKLHEFATMKLTLGKYKITRPM